MNAAATSLLESVSPFLINVAWQAVVILAVAIVLERVVRWHATARHAVLLCGLIATLALPAVLLVEQRLGLNLIFLRPGLSESAPELRFAIEGGSPFEGEVPPLEMSVDMETSQPNSANALSKFELATMVCLAVWTCGSTLLLIRALTAWCALGKLRMAARAASSPALKAALQMAKRLQPGRLPCVLVSGDVHAPLSAGIVRPYVLLPEFALASQSPIELCDVLLHEFAHVRRRDAAVVWLQRLATLLYWPIPLLHVLNRRLDEAREDICDNHVIAVADPVEYSRALLEFGRRAGTCRHTLFSTCLLSRTRTLETRIQGLLDERRRPLVGLRRPAMSLIVASFAALAGGLGTVQLRAEASDPTQNPALILNKAIAALNGEEALKKLHAVSWRFTSKAHGQDGIASISGKAYRQGGDQYRCELHFEMEDVRADSIEVINGSQGWAKAKTGQVVATADEEDFSHAKINRLYLAWITTLLPLKGKSYKLSPAGELTFGSHQTSGVLVFRSGYSDVVLYFDKETGLLVKSEMPIKVTRGPEHEIGAVRVQETYFDEYDQSDGVRYPSKITTYLDGRLRSQVEIFNLKTHLKLDDSLFAKP